MRPVLDAWVRLLGAARAAGLPVIYTTPVSRADGADVVLLPTDLGARTGVPSLTNCVEGTPDAEFPEEIAPQPADYVFLKRECCWGGDPEAHAYSLNTAMAMFGRIRTLQEVERLLALS
jgi:nicotinamidase-related amidase